MKVVILAGGYGTRISEESHLRPKPMIEIGEKPILWHVMKGYSHYGFHEFIICCGYKQHLIKEYFANYFLYNSNVTYDFSNGGSMIVHNHIADPWKVTLVDTGFNTMTGGRIKRIQKYVGDETFMMTYGDGVSNINISDLVAFHKGKGKTATLTAIKPSQRFGVLDIDKETNAIRAFREKSSSDGSRVNAGYMVLEPQIFEEIEGDATVFEREPLENCVRKGQLNAFKHDGYWQCMDTKREYEQLQELWKTGNAPWKVWDSE